MNIHVHIERLVLDGYSMTPAQRTAFQSAAEAELGRLIASGGVSDAVSAGFAVPALQAGPIHPLTPLHPVSLGHQVARSLYAGIGRRPR